MSPRVIAGGISAIYGIVILAAGWTANPYAFGVGLFLLAMFVIVDGRQARRERAARDAEQIQRILDRQLQETTDV